MGEHAKIPRFVSSGLMLVTLAVGCGSSDQASRTLTASDVSNLPAGNAVGTSFSGTYWLKDGMISACDCRVGECSRWHITKGDTFALAETDGALHVALHSNGNATDEMYSGGINRGGDFRVGSIFPNGGNNSYSLLSGSVIAGVSIDAESRNSFLGKIDGDDFDCDLTAQLALSYLAP